MPLKSVNQLIGKVIKINSAIYNLLISILLLFILITCKKENISIAPTVVISTVTNISANSASCECDITSDGGSAITSRGVCWSSTNPTPTISDSKFDNGTGSGNYFNPITGLSPGITYYLRAYAINCVGTGYSSQVTFVTPGFESGTASVQNLLKIGLVAYFPFNGNANDESGNGLNGLVHGATLTSDRFGKANSCYLFSENTDITIPNSQNLNLYPFNKFMV